MAAVFLARSVFLGDSLLWSCLRRAAPSLDFSNIAITLSYPLNSCPPAHPIRHSTSTTPQGMRHTSATTLPRRRRRTLGYFAHGPSD